MDADSAVSGGVGKSSSLVKQGIWVILTSTFSVLELCASGV